MTEEDKELIEPEKVEHFLRKHGVLLEHEVYNRLSSYVWKQYARDPEQYRFLSKPLTDISVEYTLMNSDGEDIDHEIDVYVSSYLAMKDWTFKAQEPDQIYGGHRWAERSYEKEHIHNTLLVECKGHSSEGFLLTKHLTVTAESNREAFNLQQNFYEYIQRKHENAAMIETKCDMVVDWAEFVKPSDINRPKNNDTEERKRKYYFQEDKKKFSIAVEQTRNNIAHYHKSILPELVKNLHYSREHLRLVPLIVTNAPIFLMLVLENVVTVMAVPWVMYRNKRNSLERFGHPEGEIVPVVRSQHLIEFLDSYLYSDLSSMKDLRRDESIEFYHKFELVEADLEDVSEDEDQDESP